MPAASRHRRRLDERKSATPGREKPAIRSDRKGRRQTGARADARQASAGKACATCPQLCEPYSQVNHGEKNFCLAQKAGSAVCKCPLSPKASQLSDAFVLNDWARRPVLWIRDGALARLQHRKTPAQRHRDALNRAAMPSLDAPKRQTSAAICALFRKTAVYFKEQKVEPRFMTEIDREGAEKHCNDSDLA